MYDGQNKTLLSLQDQAKSIFSTYLSTSDDTKILNPEFDRHNLSNSETAYHCLCYMSIIVINQATLGHKIFQSSKLLGF